MATNEATRRLLSRLPTGLKKDEGSQNDKWLSVPGKELQSQRDKVDAVTKARNPLTAEAGALDRWGQQVDVYRAVSETDVSFRPTVLAEFKKFRSKTTRDEVKKFVADATKVTVADVKLVENKDAATGARRPRYYSVEVPVSGLVAAGENDQTKIQAVFDKVEALLDKVDAAGVLGEFKTSSSFAYAGDGGDLGAATGGDAGTDATGYNGDNADLGTNRGDTCGFWGGFPL